MKILLFALIAAAASTLAHARELSLTWNGNNPPSTVIYIIEYNNTNVNDEDAWSQLDATANESYLYDETRFGRAYFRVWAQSVNPDPETGLPVRSESPSNVATTVVKPNPPSNHNVQ